MARLMTPYRRKYLNLAITEHRRKLKALAIEYKGGACTQCGYNKSPVALDFHHTDPGEKDFAISGDIKSFERLKPELDKCILLCANCHREHHDAEALVAFKERKAAFAKLPKPIPGKHRT